MRLGVVFDCSVNKREQLDLTARIKQYSSKYEYCEVGHYHGDKFKYTLTDVNESALSALVHEFSKTEYCHGVFEAISDDNPLDVTTRLDFYGRKGTFFGENTAIEHDGDGPYSEL